MTVTKAGAEGHHRARPVARAQEVATISVPEAFQGRPMALTELDLRLLRVMDALLETNSVQRAAERLFVTPSAISHSLRALRDRFADPLFVRVGAGLQPTPLAEAMRPSLRLGLAELERVLRQEVGFDPARSTRTFTLACPDLPLFTILPDLVACARRNWPNLDFRISALRANLSGELASGQLDLVLAGAEVEGAMQLDRELMRSRIIAEQLVCVLAHDHPALVEGNELTVERYLAWPHVLVSTGGGATGIVDAALREQGLGRRVALTVPSFAAAMLIATQSDLIATVPPSIAERAATLFGAVLRRAPIELPIAAAYLWWHPRFQYDTAHVWWRSQLMEAFVSLRS